MNSRPRFLLLALSLLLGLALPASAELWPPRLSLAVEGGPVSYGELGSWEGYRQTSAENLDTPRSYELSLKSDQLLGFRLGWRLHDQLLLSWSRLEGESQYQAKIDGVEQVHDPEAAPASLLPRIETRVDWVSLPRYGFLGLTPTIRAGYGWILHSQDGPLQITGRPPANHSDSDRGVDLGIGVEGRWRWLRAGGEMRSFHWRWDPNDEFLPAGDIHQVMGSLWLAIGY